MSQLNVQTIKLAAESVARSVRLMGASWVHFNGTGTVAIGDSENTSSITDIGAGTYGHNFTTSFAAADYSSVATGTDNVNNFGIGASNQARAANNASFRFQSSNHAGYDSIFTSVTCHGDLV